MRAISVLIVAALVLGNAMAFGREPNLILEQEPRTDFTVFGWTFLVLTLGTLAYGAKVYDDSQDDLDKAELNFASYQAAASDTEATTFRNAVSENLNDARANENRANLALFMAFMFGLTSWYSFNAEDLPDTGLALTTNSIILRHRF